MSSVFSIAKSSDMTRALNKLVLRGTVIYMKI